MRLTIDARKLHDTGIGTYVRELVPRVARAWPGPVRVLRPPGDAAWDGLLAAPGIELRDCTLPGFGWREQGPGRAQLLDADGLTWATSLAHPLYPRARMVHTVHDLLPLQPSAPRLRRWVARAFFDSVRRSAHGLLFVSAWTRDEFERRIGPSAAPSAVTPLGVAAEWFEEADGKVPAGASSAPAAPPCFMLLGNLRPHKNAALALDALARAPELPHRLVVVGPAAPADASALRARARALGLDHRLELAGRLPREAVRRRLQAAEALLFPSRREGFGLPVLEAMAAGCPVIVARNGVSPELTGAPDWTFHPDDADGLARLLRRLAALPPHDRQALVDAGRARARLFRWEHTAAATAALLQRCAAGAGAAGRGHTARGPAT